ncbi:MAG: MFS transporter [Acidimicrobiales bacterium]
MSAVPTEMVRVAPGGANLTDTLDAAPLSRFHRRAAVVSGVGFFTDAYDLFVISTVAALVSVQWHLTIAETSWVSGSAILGAFVGALVFGRLADVLGRRKIYVLVAAIMVAGAVLGALAPDFAFLTAARFVLGLGVGGDYPVSAVLMSEYANRKDRGRLVSLVFSMQALGLVVGPLVAIGLLESHVGNQLTWRLLLGLGAVPAAAVIYLRSRIPESPRFQAGVRGQVPRAVAELARFSGGKLAPVVVPLRGGDGARPPRRPRLVDLARDRRLLRLLLGTAGSWFVFDYAYYGNTLSLPVILKDVDPGADLVAKLAWSLVMFVAFAVPGYAVAVLTMDRIGHRRLQLVGFGVLALTFSLLAAAPFLTASVGAFVAVFGLSYYFVEFGPNTTTFVLPSEVFPVAARATGHGVSAGVGKLGALIGVFLVPALDAQLGLRGMIAVAGAAAVVGAGLTLLLPEPARRGLEEVSGDQAREGERAADRPSRRPARLGLARARGPVEPDRPPFAAAAPVARRRPAGIRHVPAPAREA